MGARIHIAAHDAYTLIAAVFALMFAAVTPPFGAGDETAHFERAYEVATGAFLGAEGVAAGMQRLIDDAFGKVKRQEGFSDEDFRRWAAIDLDKATVTPFPEPLRIVLRLHNPLCYIHMAPLLWAGRQLDLPPLALFYLCRLAALVAGLALVRAAIRTAPAFKLQFASIALLPTAVVFLGAANIESLLIGLGFFFIAKIMALAAAPERRLTARDIAVLAATAFLIHQFKTAYFLVPALALLLPATKFASLRQRAATLALIYVPGLVVNLVWVSLVRTYMIAGLVYSTAAGGNVVDPSAQLAAILAEPLTLPLALWRTLAAPEFWAWTLESFIGVGGWTNIAMPAWAYAATGLAAALLWMSGPAAPWLSRRAVAFEVAVFAATFLAALSLLYLQWTGVGAARIDGFQGRYLLSVAPLLFAAAPYRLAALAGGRTRAAILAAGALTGLAAMLGAVAAQYYHP